MDLKRNFLFGLFSLPFIFLPSVKAEEVPTFDLGEIVVTEDEGRVFGTPSTVEVTSRDIEIKNAQTVDEALDFIPGVRLTVGQKNEPYVMIRGFNQDKALILLDGIPIASPCYGYVDLNQIPTESIAKIKVIKSLISPLYGANTLGGVIDIVIKKPPESPYLELSTGFSARHTQHSIVDYAAKSKNTSLWFSGSHRESDGFTLSRKFEAGLNENGGLRENSFYKKNGFSLKVGLEKFEKHNLTTFFNYIDNEKGIPPHVSSSAPKYWRFAQWRRWMVALTDESQITDSLSIKGRIFYDKYDNTLKSYDDSSYTTQSNASSWTSIYDEYAIGSNIYFVFDPTNKHLLKGAVNFKRDVHREQDDIGQPWEMYEIETYSFGLEDEIAMSEKFSLSGGASFDVFDQIKAYTGQRGDSVDSFNPVLTASYVWRPQTSLYASASKRTRFPTIHQLFSATSGNQNLKEQKNINYEVGIQHGFEKGATIELSCFYNDVKDLIDRASKNDQFLNTSQAVFKGIETTVRTPMGRYLSSCMGYVYLDARDKNPDLFGRSEEELSYTPKHKADFGLDYVTDFGLSCHLLGSYSGERYYYDSANNQHALGGYSVWSVKISQKFLTHWEGSIYVENIFDRNYQEEEGYPQPGRTFSLNIKAIF